MVEVIEMFKKITLNTSKTRSRYFLQKKKKLSYVFAWVSDVWGVCVCVCVCVCVWSYLYMAVRVLNLTGSRD